MISLFSTFQKGLQKTATAISRGIASVFTDVKRWDDSTFKRLEDALLDADFGPAASSAIVKDIRDRYQRGLIFGSSDILSIAAEDLVAMFGDRQRPLNLSPNGLTTILMVGVNGSGKTTTAGKLAHLFARDGKKVTLAACDTFRAAAAEQLNLWAERTGAQLISSKQGADPAAVAFDAVQSALARKSDILIIDTAGRQHNQKGLMDELAKMRRIIAKLQPDGPQETLLTIDASIGQNAVAQAREFAALSGASALVLTKLDGTGKGGAAVQIQSEFKLPVLFVGLGEQPDDLQPFDPVHYADAVFDLKKS